MSRKTAHEAIIEAQVAHAAIQPRIAHALAGAHATDHDSAMRSLNTAIEQATDLKTRLEICQLEIAAASNPLPASKRENAA